MQKVITLVTIEASFENEAMEKIKGIRNISESHLLYGPYDLYAKAEARTTEELEQLVVNDIRNIKGVRSTMTCFIAD